MNDHTDRDSGTLSDLAASLGLTPNPTPRCTATDHTHCQLALCSTAYAAMLGTSRIGLADVRADRDRAYRLLDQTRAALRVALHHLNDRPSLTDDAAHEQRENELATCRIALKDATEAVEAADLGSRPAHGDGIAQAAEQWRRWYTDSLVRMQELDATEQTLIDALAVARCGQCRRCVECQRDAPFAARTDGAA